MDYGCIIWSQANKCDLNRIYNQQKRIIKSILQKPLRTPTDSLLLSLKWLTFHNCCRYHTGIMIYKALHNLTPPYISNLVSISDSKLYIF